MAFHTYALELDHKHVPEIQEHAGLSSRPLFVPSYGSFRQGILLTIPIRLELLATRTNVGQIRDCLSDFYARMPNIKVHSKEDVKATSLLDPQKLNGSDGMELGVFANEKHGQVLLTAVLDNLGKGAAGAAIQNLDILLT